jgi:hypothetical protein
VPRTIAWPLIIGLIGLGLRLAFVSEYAGHPLGRHPWVDEGAYWTRAQAICAGAWLPERPFYQDPLFPYLLAGVMSVVGTDVSRLRIALSCLGAVTPLVVYWAGRRGLGPAEAIVAGLLAAACGPWVFADGLVEKEGMAALAAALALGLTAAAGSRAGRAAAVGVAWGAVALLRSNALVLAPLGAAWWLGQGQGRRPGTGTPRRRQALLFLLGFLLTLAPVTIVNALVSDPTEWILTTWQAGANFYIGNGPEATGTYTAPDFVEANPAREADDFAAEACRRAGRPLTPAAVSRFWFAAGLNRWRDAPLASLRLLGRKLGLLVHDFEIPDNQDFEVVRLVAAPRLAWGFVSFGVLLPLAALGLGVSRSARTAFWGFLVLATVAGLASTALFFVVGRYRIPWLPGVALLAAAGVVDTVRRLAARQWWATAWRIGLLAVPAAALAWRPLTDPTPARWGHAQIELALANLAEGRLEPAIDALDDARALGADTAARVADLIDAGVVHDRLASLVVLRLDRPRSLAPATDLQRARWFRQLPETRSRSRRLLEARLRSAPDDPAARREYGAWWLGATADPEARRRAAAEFARATGDLSAAVLLALLTRDPHPLAAWTVLPNDRHAPRLRLARAILGRRSRRRGFIEWDNQGMISATRIRPASTPSMTTGTSWPAVKSCREW